MSSGTTSASDPDGQRLRALGLVFSDDSDEEPEPQARNASTPQAALAAHTASRPAAPRPAARASLDALVLDFSDEEPECVRPLGRKQKPARARAPKRPSARPSSAAAPAPVQGASDPAVAAQPEPELAQDLEREADALEALLDRHLSALRVAVEDFQGTAAELLDLDSSTLLELRGCSESIARRASDLVDQARVYYTDVIQQHRELRADIDARVLALLEHNMDLSRRSSPEARRMQLALEGVLETEALAEDLHPRPEYGRQEVFCDHEALYAAEMAAR